MLTAMSAGHAWNVRTGARRALAVALTAVSLVGIASGGGMAATGSGERPLSVVRAYIAALDRHDVSAVCALFSAPLKSFLIRTTPALPRHASCRTVVASHFTGYYSDHRWAGAVIVHVGAITIRSAPSIAAVHLTFAHRYVCVGPAVSGQPCHPGVIRRPDIIYLIQNDSGWQILKAGLVFDATDLDEPNDPESTFYPPGDAATSSAIAAIGGPRFYCPPSQRARTDPSHDVTDPSGDAVHAPWLDITRLGVSRINSDTVCFRLTLAAPPRADSGYDILAIHDLRGGAVGEGGTIAVEVDGLGQPHALIGGQGILSTPSIAAYLPRFGLVGDQLEIAAAIPPSFTSGSGLLVASGTESLQPDEPLLAHPLNGGDTAPDHGCLRFPAGGISTADVCGESASD